MKKIILFILFIPLGMIAQKIDNQKNNAIFEENSIHNEFELKNTRKKYYLYILPYFDYFKIDTDFYKAKFTEIAFERKHLSLLKDASSSKKDFIPKLELFSENHKKDMYDKNLFYDRKSGIDPFFVSIAEAFFEVLAKNINN